MADLFLVAIQGRAGTSAFRRDKAGWQATNTPTAGYPPHDPTPATLTDRDVACASQPAGPLHLVTWDTFNPPPGFLVETSRRAPLLYEDPLTAGWEPWAAAESHSDPDIRPLKHIAAAATPQGDLHIVVVTQSGSVWYTTKFADGRWRPTWLGDFPTPDIRPISDVACACSPNGDLIVCALNNTGKGRLYYAIRSAAGDWSATWLSDFPAPDIRPIAHPTDWDMFWHWPIRPIACAVTPPDDLHVCVIAQAGDVYHAVRDSAGSWRNFQKLDKAASGVVRPLASVAMCSDASGTLHVAVTTRLTEDGSGDNGQLWYATQPAGGSFGAFERLSALHDVRTIGIGASEW